MMVRFDEDEYIAVAILIRETESRQWRQWMKFFSYLDEDMKFLILLRLRNYIISAMKDIKNCRKP